MGDRPERERERAFKALKGECLVRDAGTYQVWGEVVGGVEYEYATNPDGDLIGSAEDAAELCSRHGIAPERRRGTQEGVTCSVGFCAREQKWYGWSHRARRGFGIGDEAFLVEVAPDGYAPVRRGHGVRIATLEEARQSAELFAEDVS